MGREGNLMVLTGPKPKARRRTGKLRKQRKRPFLEEEKRGEGGGGTINRGAILVGLGGGRRTGRGGSFNKGFKRRETGKHFWRTKEKKKRNLRRNRV